MPNDYMMYNEVLREMSKPTAATANPQLAPIMNRWAAAKSAANAREIIESQNLALDRKKIFMNVLSAREALDAWERQNNLASIISGATIPVQGLASLKQIQQQETQTKRIGDMIAKNKELAEIIKQSTITRDKKQREFLKEEL